MNNRNNHINLTKSKERVQKHGEVFTPAWIVNDMLNMLPKEVWETGKTFLEPACGEGAFLVEIYKRKLEGISTKAQTEWEQQAAIATSSVYGIELLEDNAKQCTINLMRVFMKFYNKKFPNTQDEEVIKTIQFILSKNIIQGNALTYRKCVVACGNKCNNCDLIIFSEWMPCENKQFKHKDYSYEEMKFNVVIGNPPYQEMDGGAQASAIPIYHNFVQQAKKFNPDYISMIMPSRWFAGGRGLDKFRNEMLSDNKISILHDFISANDCFSGVEIKGGVCYFLWDKNKTGLCKVHSYANGKLLSIAERPLLESGCDTFVRYNEAIPILRKVLDKKEESFSTIVSSMKPFGLRGYFSDFQNEPFENSIKLYANRKIGHIKLEQIITKTEWIGKHKIYVPRNSGIGNIKKDRLKPMLGEPNSCCTETYIVIGPFDDKKTMDNVYSYMQTKFFHLLLALKKISQSVSNKVFSFVPLQDFTEAWTDEKLYEKYELTSEEVNFIESSAHFLGSKK